MLFEELLFKYDSEISFVVDELFKSAFNNQTHEQDLLLIHQHGHFFKEGRKELMIGPGDDGHAELSQYKFFDKYRIVNIPNMTEFKEILNKDIKIREQEEYFLHVELMIYLKFWEADMILKKLYQLARLSSGEEYSWDFNIKKYKKGRQELIRLDIRDKMLSNDLRFGSLVNDLYSSKVRNAIAHSQYYFVERSIWFSNNGEHIPAITFEDWEVKFHKLVLLYNHIIKNFNNYHQLYVQKVKDKHFGLQVRVQDDVSCSYKWLQFDSNYKRWYWSQLS